MLPTSVIDTYHRELTQVVSEHGLDIFRMQPPRPSNQKTIRVCCGGPTEARLQGFKDLFGTDETSVQTDTIHANNSLIGYMQAQVVLLFFKDRADFNAWVEDGVEADFLRLTQPVNGEKRFGVYCADQLPLDEMRDILGSDNVSTFVDLDAAVRDLGQERILDPYVDSMVMVPSGSFVYGDSTRPVRLPNDARGLFLNGVYIVGDVLHTEGLVLYGCTPDVRGATNIRLLTHTCDTSQITRPFLMAQAQLTEALSRLAAGVRAPMRNISEFPMGELNWFSVLQLANALSASKCYTGVARGPRGSATWSRDCSGFRLPTEREWEYAARAFSTFIYSGGDLANEVAWFKKNAHQRPHAVGQLKPNAFGVYDLSGNMAEWCWDLFDPEQPYRSLRGGTRDGDENSILVTHRSRADPNRQASTFVGRFVRGIP